MIYLDYNATTPVDHRVMDAMVPFLTEHYGNPGSNHALGFKAREAIEIARMQVADLINAGPNNIVFTGCATEGNNTIIKGVANAQKGKGRHIIASAVEHPSVIEPLRKLESQGWEVTYLPVDEQGLVDPEDLKKALRDDTVLLSIMHANNETGTIMPIAKLAAIAKFRGVPVHCDAAQSTGKILVDVEQLGVDYLTMAGHKFYAPKGVGALYIREDAPYTPLLDGGGQEMGFRSGTENVAYIVGLGKAAQLAKQLLEEDKSRIERLRDELHLKIANRVKVRLIGHPTLRLPNTLNLAFVDCKGERVLQSAPLVAAGLGAACHDRNVTMSPVLKAMNVPPELARGAIRLTLGRFCEDVAMEAAADALVESAEKELSR